MGIFEKSLFTGGNVRMNLIQAIDDRRSIRAFKPVPVPKELIENILNLIIEAPSAINLQPWEFVVTMGEEKERLSRKLIKSYREKQISCSPGNVKPLADTFSKRGLASVELMTPSSPRWAMSSTGSSMKGELQLLWGTCRYHPMS